VALLSPVRSGIWIIRGFDGQSFESGHCRKDPYYLEGGCNFEFALFLGNSRPFLRVGLRAMGNVD
jgi:hypothetical protein